MDSSVSVDALAPPSGEGSLGEMGALTAPSYLTCAIPSVSEKCRNNRPRQRRRSASPPRAADRALDVIGSKGVDRVDAPTGSAYDPNRNSSAIVECFENRGGNGVRFRWADEKGGRTCLAGCVARHAVPRRRSPSTTLCGGPTGRWGTPEGAGWGKSRQGESAVPTKQAGMSAA
jgi:hypothetical protein